MLTIPAIIQEKKQHTKNKDYLLLCRKLSFYDFYLSGQDAFWLLLGFILKQYHHDKVRGSSGIIPVTRKTDNSGKNTVQYDLSLTITRCGKYVKFRKIPLFVRVYLNKGGRHLNGTAVDWVTLA
jgi:hypothetical protein